MSDPSGANGNRQGAAAEGRKRQRSERVAGASLI